MNKLDKFHKLKRKRPFKQYLRKEVNITFNHDMEIRLIQSALKDRGTEISYSHLIEKMIDAFLEDMGKVED